MQCITDQNNQLNGASRFAILSTWDRIGNSPTRHRNSRGTFCGHSRAQGQKGARDTRYPPFSGTPFRTLSGTLRSRRARKTSVPGQRAQGQDPKTAKYQKCWWECKFVLKSVQTRCIVRGEAQKSPLSGDFLRAFDFLRSACSLRIPLFKFIEVVMP